MATKENKIRDIAQDLFFRHGYKKVTMTDIAQTLGVSRPTLYKSFSSIESILASIVRNQIASNQAESLSRLKSKKDLKTKLECLFDIWITEPFASVIDSENGRELLVNCADYAPEALAELYQEFENELARVFDQGSRGISKLSAKDLAHLLMLATKGLKASTETLPELKRLIKGLIILSLLSAEGKNSK